MSRITQADLEKYLFGCADILRNYVEASSYINAIIGIVIGYLLIFPLIGIFTPVTYTVLLAAAAFAAHSRGLDTYSMTASILLMIHLIRTISMFVLVRKYPAQTRNMDADYQRR